MNQRYQEHQTRRHLSFPLLFITQQVPSLFQILRSK
ncbi:hypothetical protein pb186bvf_020976 [Paramecium bursaria]